MKRALTLITSFVLTLLLFACSSNKELITEAPSYENVLKQYTRDAKVYENLETKLIAYATYKSDLFMNAQIDKKAKDFLYDSAKVDLLKLNAKRDNEKYISFFVAVYTPDDRFADFSKEKGLWFFHMFKGKYGPKGAVKVKKVSKSDMPAFEVLYPYISPWMQGYEVSFNVIDSAKNVPGLGRVEKPLTLIITGPLGKMELSYN